MGGHHWFRGAVKPGAPAGRELSEPEQQRSGLVEVLALVGDALRDLGIVAKGYLLSVRGCVAMDIHLSALRLSHTTALGSPRSSRPDAPPRRAARATAQRGTHLSSIGPPASLR